MVVLAGLILSLTFITIGWRSAIAIGFWRVCLRQGVFEAEDSDQFEFFSMGSVRFRSGQRIIAVKPGELPHRLAGATEGGTPSAKHAVFRSFPWNTRWATGVNDVIGALLPAGTVVFWTLVSFSIQASSGPVPIEPGLPWWIVGASFAAGAALASLYLVRHRPWKPAAQPQTATLLAVLGRGIQRIDGEWLPTEDYEMCVRNELGRWAHSVTRIPIVEASEGCLIGGGSMNIEAALTMLAKDPIDTVAAFAPQAAYLRRWNGAPSSDAPTESDCMTELIRKGCPQAVVFPWSGPDETPSNTEHEVANVMGFARKRGYRLVRFLTVCPHANRVGLLASRHPGVKFEVLTSDGILAAASEAGLQRVQTFRASAPYARSVTAEAIGTGRIENDRSPSTVLGNEVH